MSRPLLVACLMLLSPEAVAADACPQPIYRGLQHGAIMRFVGETGALVYREQGTIETKAPRRVFKFETTHSNGYSREYILLKDRALGDDLSSLVIRKNADFTNADGPAPFLLTPDLDEKLYYATNQEGQEALHAIRLDDTWRLVGCGGPASRRR